ncbi:zinc-binding dehydrogenase [Microbispora sp. NPDC046933]|uniref:zinc-binding dehydrogenase n=1 Tax=Microbispora sp. NPDC046933 TaxID=3155618 RepID=UPI0033E94211
MDQPTMRAVVHAGAPGVAGFRTALLPRPEPGPGQVLVRIHCAALNRHDLFVAAGRDGTEPPLVVGSDGAGEVAALGPGASGVAVGDEVVVDPTLGWPAADDVPGVPRLLGGPPDGTLAEYVVVPAANVHPRPEGLDWVEAAALPLVAVTSFRALFTRGGLRAGQHVLVPAVSSGVGTMCVLMALAAGARVTAVTRSAAKAEAARALGAHEVILGVDGGYPAPRTPVDLVVDSVGAAYFASHLAALRSGGRLVTLGATTGPDVSVSLRELFFRQISVVGTSVGSSEEFAEAMAFVRRHDLRPVVHDVRPFDEAVQALHDLRESGHFGKSVIRVSA